MPFSNFRDSPLADARSQTARPSKGRPAKKSETLSELDKSEESVMITLNASPYKHSS